MWNIFFLLTNYKIDADLSNVHKKRKYKKRENVLITFDLLILI